MVFSPQVHEFFIQHLVVTVDIPNFSSVWLTDLLLDSNEAKLLKELIAIGRVVKKEQKIYVVCEANNLIYHAASGQFSVNGQTYVPKYIKVVFHEEKLIRYGQRICYTEVFTTVFYARSNLYSCLL